MPGWVGGSVGLVAECADRGAGIDPQFADRIFEPALLPGGALADSLAADVLGVGPGRGIALLFVLTGLFSLLLTLVGLLYPRLRRVEEELPDIVARRESHAGQDVAA